MMEAPEKQLQALHEVYNALTGQTLRFRPFERHWADFVRAGYAEADLRLVLQYIDRLNRKNPNCPTSRRLNTLLDDLARFESLRGEAESQERARAAHNRAWRPSQAERERAAMCGHDPVAPAKEPVLSRDAILANLDKLKQTLAQPEPTP